LAEKRAQRQARQLAARLPLIPLFRHEGPGLYASAFQHNARFAKPGPYQTRLPHGEEQAFRDWVRHRGVPFDPNAHVTDYDMRGFWKQTGGRGWHPGSHFPDTFKTPYDTTFSRESRYASSDNPYVWRGDKLVNRRTGQIIFAPPSR
jgi:hypothetical protein